MWFNLLLGVAVGAGPDILPDPPPLPEPIGRAFIGNPPPIDSDNATAPPGKAFIGNPLPNALPRPRTISITVAQQQPADSPPVEFNIPGLPPAAPKAEEKPAAVVTPPDRWFLMRNLQGNWLGAVLDDNRTSISGWVEQSFTGSTASVNNQPVVWNDRANSYLLNSAWVRLDRSVVTTGTTEPTWGYRVDLSMGTDYRFSMMRGLFNNQLKNSQFNADGTPAQNLYGIDPIQFYTNVYIPTLFQGTDIRAGRLFTPWGYESLEGISTPFVSRSYAFNWSPPFTHMGIMASTTFTPQWSAKFMLANGNDVFLNSDTQELRAVGALTWTSYDKRDSATFGFTVGRGRFDTSAPYNPATVGEQTEPAGRNNINVFDLVYTHAFNPRLSYAAELLYGYQTNVPANVAGGIITNDAVPFGTARWASIAQYMTYVVSPQVTSITRLEFFDDFDGQRTGFQGLYTAITTGLQIKPYKSLMIRPELRFDYNGQSLPFEGKNYLFTAAIDAIIRF